jgi:pilus assembly protein Flp/PilA
MYTDYLKALVSSKKGQGMVEYGLIISLIAVAVIAALVILGPKIANLFNNVSESIK